MNDHAVAMLSETYGWCYAAAPLVQALIDADTGISLRLHGEGLFEGVSPPMAKRQNIRVADARIAALTDQTFGRAYLDDPLSDPDLRYYSAPPIAAILAAEMLLASSFPRMLKAIQEAHYRRGLMIVESDTLAKLANAIDLSGTSSHSTDPAQRSSTTPALMR